MASRDLTAWVEQAVADPAGQRVLLLGEFAPHLEGENITRLLRHDPGVPLPGGNRGFDLAVAVNVLQDIDREAGAALLAALRDLTARRLMVAVPASSGADQDAADRVMQDDILRDPASGTGTRRPESMAQAIDSSSKAERASSPPRDARGHDAFSHHPAKGASTTPHEWTRTEMLSYGLECLGEARHAGKLFTVYGFDIDRYKRTPDWLNARNWANPENWGRFRW